MTAVTSAREADRLTGDTAAPGRPPLDLAPVEGDWISATGLPGGMERLTARHQGGALIVSARGHGEPDPGEWGSAPATVFASSMLSTTGQAFTATFDHGHVRSHVQTYQGLGVQVMHVFHRFTDSPRESSYFTREFYVAVEGGQAAPVTQPNDDLPVAARGGHDDPAGLLGTWRALTPDVTKSIASLECSRVDGRFSVRGAGVGPGGPVDWGATEGQLYADAHYLDNAPAFLATFDHGYMRVHVQARINRGVLVVVEYTEFTDDSGRSNYFIRECFRR
jgi:hypothetical protein